MFKSCRKEIEVKVSKGALHGDTADYMKKYDHNFLKVFNKAMEFNLNILSKEANKSGASALVAEYIEHYILKQDKIQSNFASLYEQRERAFGLN